MNGVMGIMGGLNLARRRRRGNPQRGDLGAGAEGEVGEGEGNEWEAEHGWKSSRKGECEGKMPLF